MNLHQFDALQILVGARHKIQRIDNSDSEHLRKKALALIENALRYISKQVRKDEYDQRKRSSNSKR